MKVSTIAKKYAKALFEIAKEKNCVEKVMDEFEFFLVLLNEDNELNSLIRLPNAAKREKIILDTFQKRFSKVFVNFLLIVLKNKRYYLLQQIFDDFQIRYDLENNRIRAQAITAIPLSEERLSELSQRISNYLNAEVRIENKVDPSIIGGIIISVNGQLFDASLTEQLRKLKLYLIKNQN